MRPFRALKFYILDLIMYIGLRFFTSFRMTIVDSALMTIVDSALEFMPYEPVLSGAEGIRCGYDIPGFPPLPAQG